MSKLSITEDGKCPICLIKPLTYKRDGHYWCGRCCRTFSLSTGEWLQSSQWIKPYTMQGSAAVVEARKEHQFIEIKDNDSFNCIDCGIGINARDWLEEHDRSELL